MIQVAQILFILSVLVILHEFGHYITAKMFKVRVEKFYLFMDAGFSLIKKKIGETEWGIGWLPLGGYVKLSGMIDESLDTAQMSEEPQPWEFRSTLFGLIDRAQLVRNQIFQQQLALRSGFGQYSQG